MVKNLEKEELNEINGGLIKTTVGVGLGLGIGSAAAFLIGLVSGWVRPYTCSSSK